MLRALLAGVSGLKNHQLRMDVIGNNIANVNTVGFKASRVSFQEGFAQVLANAMRPEGNRGGTNPSQVGTGVVLGSVDSRFTQGGLELTGQPLDLAIQGDALFALSGGEQTLYTRAGNFQIDSDGRLVLPGTGLILQGMSADSEGKLVGGMGDVLLPIGDKAPPKATGQVEIAGNLDTTADIGATHSIGVTVYDQVGKPYQLTLNFTYEGNGTWNWTPSIDEATVTSSSPGTAVFDADGNLTSFTYPDGGDKLVVAPDRGETFSIEILTGAGTESSDLTGYAGTSTAAVKTQDGYQAGDLINIRIDPDGVINGLYSNGASRVLAQIALATFPNPAGLLRIGGNVFEESSSSGTATLGFAGETTASTMASGALEGSNVDISEEFTNMIVTQRGFQANARVITAADDMLAELVNLRR